MHKTLTLLAASLLPASAIEIEISYEYDTAGFFDQPGAKEAMRAAADFFENILTDSLAEINAGTSGSSQNTWSARPRHPETGNILVLTNLVVPADTIIIYVGSRNLSGSTTGEASTGLSIGGFQSFLNLVQSRGQAGVLSTPATDYSPWGGAIAFDTVLPASRGGGPRQWNFSITEASGTSGRTDFMGVALHELCHILGIGQADSWDNLAPDGQTFQGAASFVANGNMAPLLQQGKGHWFPGDSGDPNTPNGPYSSPRFGSFGSSHGINQRVLMNPSAASGGSDLRVVTDLDIAGLIDIGWEVRIPPKLNLPFIAPGVNIPFHIPTTSNFAYQVQRGDLSTPFSPLGPLIQGDGTVKTVTDSTPPTGSGFYRLSIVPTTSSSSTADMEESSDTLQFYEFEWASEGCCP